MAHYLWGVDVNVDFIGTNLEYTRLFDHFSFCSLCGINILY